MSAAHEPLTRMEGGQWRGYCGAGDFVAKSLQPTKKKARADARRHELAKEGIGV